MKLIHLYETDTLPVPPMGLKLGSRYRLWRGINDTSGHNGADYGRGLYTTTNRKYAAEYGKVIEVSRWEALPDNPIRFNTVMEWQNWLYKYDRYNGIAPRDRYKIYPHIDEYVRLNFPDVDGVQIGTTNDTIFVAWAV